MIFGVLFLPLANHSAILGSKSEFEEKKMDHFLKPNDCTVLKVGTKSIATDYPLTKQLYYQKWNYKPTTGGYKYIHQRVPARP